MKPLSMSQDCIALNPQLSAANGKKNAVAGFSRANLGLHGAMNKTEAEFAMILQAQKRAGEILRYEFEGITLRLAADYLTASKS